jgi:hypothetical protein
MQFFQVLLGICGLASIGFMILGDLGTGFIGMVLIIGVLAVQEALSMRFDDLEAKVDKLAGAKGETPGADAEAATDPSDDKPSGGDATLEGRDDENAP